VSVRSSVQTTIARGGFLGRRGVREILLIGALYVFYCVTRTFADGDLGPAQDRAGDLLSLEKVLHLDWEHALNDWFVGHAWAAIPADYFYAAGHYMVTLWVLVWLYRKGAQHYTPARWALVVACLIGLACYLLLPTAPPRMLDGFNDVMSLLAADGWWSTDASAPKGLGSLTNELAAFPSLHAGWALWVALVVRRSTRNYWARGLGWIHAVITAVVVIGTGNHWILDVAVGWAVVIVAMWLVDPWFADSRHKVKARRLALRGRIAGPDAPVERTPDRPTAPGPVRADPLGADRLTRDSLRAEGFRGDSRGADSVDACWAEPPPKRRFDC
jgi:membrane-associated phospholipid phosphatase